MGWDKEKQREHRSLHKEEKQKYDRQYYSNHKEKKKEEQKKYRSLHKEEIKKQDHERHKRYRRDLAKYGITLKEYESILIAQNYKCKICGKHVSELNRSLFVDHDHNTGKIRGLLCQYCNSAIGYFNDDGNILLNAIDYLKGEIK
jgi:hypothetical protein